ncbi:hypothetical protein F4782DRAFT_501896 [Xylaria castorea]|nr:hypothetical protein F4782DRAFT_501896 [Xylaria castorea]
MSVISRVGARLNSASNLRRLRIVTQVRHKTEYPHTSTTANAFLTTRASSVQTTILRNISWMTFELPDPALYQSPLSLQPKRPVAAEAVLSADGTSPPAQPITMAGRVGSPSSAVASSQVSASGKVIPASVPASAMRTGPVPLSQIQKRTFASSSPDPANHEPPATPHSTTTTTPPPPPPPQGQEPPPIPPFPTLQIRMPGHPATFPVLEGPDLWTN